MKLKQKSGVYFIHIKSSETNYVYVGQSKNISKRVYQHKYKLRNNMHGNQYMQNVYNKYGIHSIKVLYFEKQYLNYKEQKYIDLYNLNSKYKCLNLTSVAKSSTVEHHRSKRYVIVTPNNIMFCLYNLHDFCTSNNLDSARMSAIANGKKSWYKGYQCFYCGEEYKAKVSSTYNNLETKGSKKCLLKSPDGILHCCYSISDACKAFNLNVSSLQKVLSGKRNSVYKWTGKYL